MTNEQRESLLFTCTKDPEHFVQNLDAGIGIWPRFCDENFGWLLNKKEDQASEVYSDENFSVRLDKKADSASELYLAFPMVCFTAIPASAAGYHKDRYGFYALAIRKDRAADYDINPVWYIQAGTSIETHLREQMRQEHKALRPPRVTLETIPEDLKALLPYLKPVVGGQLDRQERTLEAQAERGVPTELMVFEEEVEWRHSPPELEDHWQEKRSTTYPDPQNPKRCDVRSGIDVNAASKHSEQHRLRIDHGDIEAVYVPTEDDVTIFKDKFPDLKDKISIWPRD